MNPLSPSFFILIAAYIALGIGLWRWLRNKPQEYKRKAMTIAALGLWAMSTIFTLQRVADPNYYFPLTQNLPLHFCSMVTFLLVPAYWIRGSSRWLQAYRALLFYPGAAATFLAVIAPAEEYLNHPLLSMNTLFYFVHLGNVLLCSMLVVLGFHTPTVRGALGSLGTFFVLAMIVFPITLAIRHWLDPAANYFFSFDPAGSPIFEVLYGLIPVHLLYQVPLLVLVIPVLLLQFGIYQLVNRIAQRRHDRQHNQDADNHHITNHLLPQH